MVKLGVILLVHTALERAAQVARVWADAGCDVIVHLDKKNPESDLTFLQTQLQDLQNIQFSDRFNCDWGSWGMVAATQAASSQILDTNPDITHVYLASGSCLPLRPINELISYLKKHPNKDFIESATTRDVPWIIGGLAEERFTLNFPFSWKSNRRLFDLSVTLQRWFKIQRKIPEGVVPHLGSQWWCLTRETISGILNDPQRRELDRYFRGVWIPDESYFQTMARRHSGNIESRSLTLSKFDHLGKPHVFYDDHLQLLQRSDCFVARKIWPRANKLYDFFLSPDIAQQRRMSPDPSKIDRLFTRALERRVKGRPGLYMQSRFPKQGFENGLTARRYHVFEGFNDLFLDFREWLEKYSKTTVHGHLFHPLGVEFANGKETYSGGLIASPELRDRNPQAFLSNLIWNARGSRQSFQFGPDDNQRVGPFIARDANANVAIITGAWAVPLFKSDIEFRNKRQIAANLQKIEAEHLKMLEQPWVKARLRIWSMADFVEAPVDAIQQVLSDLGTKTSETFTELPKMQDLTGFPEFLQELKNAGMHPYIMGDFPSMIDDETPQSAGKKTYKGRRK